MGDFSKGHIFVFRIKMHASFLFKNKYGMLKNKVPKVEKRDDISMKKT